MRTIQAAIVGFSKPYFTYDSNGVKHFPSIVEQGSESITVIETGDSYFEADTIDEVMTEFNRLGFEMPEEDSWDFPEMSIRLSIPNDELTEILKAYPMVIEKFSPLKDFTVVRNRTQLIYLAEIYPDDQALFNNYIQQRP